MLMLGLLIAFVAVVSGCQRAGRALHGETFEDSYERLKGLVDGSAAAVASDLERVDVDRVPPVPCDDLVPGTETYSGGYTLRFKLPDEREADRLLVRVADHWRAAGFSVDTLHIDSDLPAVSARFEDYEFLAEVVKPKLLAEMGGNTPCLPRAAED